MLRLNHIRIKSGEIADIPSPGILCVVGGNNVGKSQLLRDVRNELSGNHEMSIILNKVGFTIDSPEQGREQWFRSNSIASPDLREGEVFRSFHGGGTQRAMRELLDSAAHPAEGLREILEWFYKDLRPGEHASLASGGVGTTNFLMSGITHPLFQVFRNGDLEETLSKICHKMFGFELTLDRINGEIRFRIGKVGIPSPSLQHPTLEYADAVQKLPPLESQGDGVKSFLGMILYLETTNFPVTVMDEPETFLHPAQARALGRYLGKSVTTRGGQFLVATHDRDFVLGLLDADTNVTFLRLDRSGMSNSAAVLGASSVRSIWDRPELRYSNVLQGLFYRVAVACEADADCRWYGAVLDEFAVDNGYSSEEVLFLPAGGKSGVQNCVSALEAIGVVCFAILDFDILLDVNQLKILLSKFKSDASNDQIILLTRSLVNSLNDDWKRRAKEGGIKALPRGTSQEVAKRVIGMLAQRRILVVPIGELESFDGALGGKGASWVTKALEGGLHKSCVDAVDVIRPIYDVLIARTL